MTAALLDRATGTTASVPAAPRRNRRRLLPQLLPVPNSEPPLTLLPGADGAPSSPLGSAARPAGQPLPRPATAAPRSRDRRETEDRYEWAHPAISAAPTMVHRRWRPTVDIVTGAAHGIQAEVPHRVHSAVGIVTSDDDRPWPIVVTPAEPTRSGQPAASDAAVVLARATIEALSGRRPFDQLRPYYTTGVFNGLQDFPMLGHRRDARLVSLWVCEPADDTAEVSAAFRCAARMRAMAMQLRAAGGRWLVTSLQLG